MARGVLVNGVSYDWGSIQVVLFGAPVVGISAISYKKKQNKENIYGAGYKPVSRGYGRIEYEGSMTLKMEEWKRIIAAAPNRNPLEIAPFAITVVLGTSGRNTPTVDRLYAVEFMDDGLDSSEGDTSIDVEIPIIIGEIER
jgi:hypothetical protein